MANRPLSVNWGVTGLAGTIAYQIASTAGSALVARTTTGITESPSGSGQYVVYVADTVAGTICWDAGDITDSASESFTAGSGGTLIITPIQATVTNPRYSTRNLAKIAAGSAPTDILNITDGSGLPVDLSGKTLRLVAFTVIDNDDDDTANLDIFDDILTGSFKYETGSGLAIGGTSHNQVTIRHDATKTATPGDYRYNLWDVTAKVLLLKGAMPIEPALFNL